MLGYKNSCGCMKNRKGIKHVILFVFLFCSVLMTACTVDGGQLLDYQQNTTGTAVRWEYDGTSYEGIVTFDGEIPTDPAQYRSATVTINSPEEIAGLTVKYSPDGVNVSVGGVTFDLPENTGQELYRLIRSLSLYSEEMKGAGNGSGTVTAVRFEAPTCGTLTEYDITYNDEGYPVSAKITWDESEITVEFMELYVNE